MKKRWSAAGDKKCIDYTDAQKASLMALIQYLCNEYDIPLRAPAKLPSYGKRLTDIDARQYAGIIAHGQTSSKRWDGLLAVELLLQEGVVEGS